MASWMIHLRIADRLLDQIPGLDKTAFVIGNIAPDSGVPNADWSAYSPPKDVSHYKVRRGNESFFDLDRFISEHFSPERIRSYSLRAFSFFLGYYAHLLTDIRWTETILAALIRDYPEECTKDKIKLIETAKEDWYDLDFLYLKQHPDFRAFSIFEKAEGFVNEFMDIFSRDAFDNRRQYICGFYRSEEHGELHRPYRYLTVDRADAFVKDTVGEIIYTLCQGVHRHNRFNVE